MRDGAMNVRYVERQSRMFNMTLVFPASLILYTFIYARVNG